MEHETVKKEHLQPQTPEDDDKETEVETISEVLQTEDNGTEAKFVKETKKRKLLKKKTSHNRLLGTKQSFFKL